MKTRHLLAAGLAAALLAPLAQAETTLRLYMGSANRPDVMRKMFDLYEQRNPGVKIVIESGGATSDLQRRYLSTVLSARDSSLDIMQIDIASPAQFMTAQWLEPLDKALDTDAASLLKPFVPAFGRANLVDGKVATLPVFIDAQFLYYRKDLLQKYNLPEPRTWDELASTARAVMDKEKQPNLQGLSIQGAPIEGTVCTFLTPYWSQGKEVLDAKGKLTLDVPSAEKGMAMWMGLLDKGVLKKNIAEVKTQDTTTDFRAGQAVFAVTWGLVWNRLQEADSPVKDKVGITALPAMPGGKSASCAGGWQWGVSAFSAQKKPAAALVKWLASPEVAKYLAINAAFLPSYPELYQDAEVRKAIPWAASVATALEGAHPRPVSARYSEMSDVIRSTTSAMLGRSQAVPAGVADIESRLKRVTR